MENYSHQERFSAAVALTYEKESDAASKGGARENGAADEQSVRIVQKNQASVFVDAHMTKLLYQVSLDKAIPGSLYELVADVLAWAYSLNNKKVAGTKMEV